MYNMILQAAADAGTVVEGLKFTTENLSEALVCSVAGMVGIFIVVGVIVLSTTILNKTTAKKNND